MIAIWEVEDLTGSIVRDRFTASHHAQPHRAARERFDGHEYPDCCKLRSSGCPKHSGRPSWAWTSLGVARHQAGSLFRTTGSTSPNDGSFSTALPVRMCKSYARQKSGDTEQRGTSRRASGITACSTRSIDEEASSFGRCAGGIGYGRVGCGIPIQQISKSPTSIGSTDARKQIGSKSHP